MSLLINKIEVLFFAYNWQCNIAIQLSKTIFVGLGLVVVWHDHDLGQLRSIIDGKLSSQKAYKTQINPFKGKGRKSRLYFIKVLKFRVLVLAQCCKDKT